eukprot:gene5224-5881_t
MPSLLKISVKKGPQGFGFILSNQSPCVVSSVIEGGPAESASLKPGDEVLEVNNQNVSRSTHEQVVRLILKTSGTWVNLKVRRYSGPTEFSNEYVDLADDNNDEFHNSIIETVDKVVEDLKSGNFKLDHPRSSKPSTSKRRGSSGREFSEDSPRLRISTPPSVSNRRTSSGREQGDGSAKLRSATDFGQNLGSSKRSGSLGKDLMTSDDSPILLPLSHSPRGLTTSRDDVSPMFENENGGSSLMLQASPAFSLSIYRVIVGYIRTIELPGGCSLTSASLEAVSNVVGGLNLTSKKINKRLLMNISPGGAVLINPGGKDIVYPVNMLAFACSCPYDSRCFGIVTRKVLNEDHRKLRRASNSRKSSVTQVHSCHVFIVDSELSLHCKHKQLASNFGFSCTPDAQTNTCKEFPMNSSDILFALNSVLRDHAGVSDLSDSSLDFATPSVDRQTHHYDLLLEKDLSNGLGLLDKLRISNELKAQQQAKSILDNQLGFDENFPKTAAVNAGAPDTQSQNGAYIITGSNDESGHLNSQISLSSSATSSLDLHHATSTPSIAEFYKDDLDAVASNIKTSMMKDNCDQQQQQQQQERLGNLLNDAAGSKNFESHGGIFSVLSMKKILTECRVGSQQCVGNVYKKPNGFNRAATEWTNDVTFLKIVAAWDFLRKEHSEENIMFWNACEKFKMLEDPCKLRQMAIEIYHTYLADGAPGLVNVDQQAVKKAEEKLISPEPNMFNLQQQQIFMLMKYDCFPRYLKSEFYRRCRSPTLESQESAEEDVENKECKKNKTHWYTKKFKSNIKDVASNEPVVEQPDRKRSILGILTKNKGPKQDSKSKGKNQKQSNSKSRVKLDNPTSDIETSPRTPTKVDHEVKFDPPKSPMEIKDVLGCSVQFCRVFLPNGSSTVLMPEPGKSIRQLLETYCSRQNVPLSSDDLFVDEDNQSVDMDEESLSFGNRVIHLLRRVQFRFDLPSKRSVAVKDCPMKTLHDVVEPIMRKNGFNIDNFEVRLAKDNRAAQLESQIRNFENKHLKAVKTKASKDSNSVLGKPPVGKASFKASQPEAGKVRKSSKDDSSLQPSTIHKTSKSQDAFNRFLRRGSLEGGLSFIKRKQALRNSLTLRSNNNNSSSNNTKAGDKQQGHNQRTMKNPHSSQTVAPKSDATNIHDTEMKRNSLSDVRLSQVARGRAAIDFNEPIVNIEQLESPVLDTFLQQDDLDKIDADDDDSFIANFSRAKESGNDMIWDPIVSDPEIQSSQIGESKNRLHKRVLNRAGQIDGLPGRAGNTGDKSGNFAATQQQRRPSRNLLDWRARENSCDSASSSATDELDYGTSKRYKVKDVKRHSSPPCISNKISPQSPRTKHQKIELKETTEVEIANSPLLMPLVDHDPVPGGRSQKLPRPTPISMSQQTESRRKCIQQ